MEFTRRRALTTPNADDSRTATVGSKSLTQRHVARVSDEQRARDHAILDTAWAVQLQRDGHTGLDDGQVQAAAAHGIQGGGSALPHLDAVQRSFGDHDLSGVQAHVGGAATEANQALGAHAYATGDHVAFAEQPSLFLVAHEAAHVVQQRSGVHLSSAVGAAGDSYEHHADAVAARVVAGESAANLLGSTSGDASVQRSAIQRDEDIGLGPAGRGAPNPVDPVQLPPPPKLDSPNVASNAWELGKKALPLIKEGMDQIKLLKDVWDLVKPGGGRGETKQLPELISPHNKTELDAVFRYKIAEAYIQQAIVIGRRFGVDFTLWQMGAPPPAKAPEPKAPAAPQSFWQRIRPPAKPEPAEPAAPAQTVPDEAHPMISALQGLAIDELKDRAVLAIQDLIAANSRRLPEVWWWWNGANESGIGGMPTLGDGDRMTYGIIAFEIAASGVPNGTMRGVPVEAEHFGITSDRALAANLAWFTGGRATVLTHEDSFDDLSVEQIEQGPANGVNPPVGAIHLGYGYKWDDSDTTVDLDLTFDLATNRAMILNVQPKNTPET